VTVGKFGEIHSGAGLKVTAPQGLPEASTPSQSRPTPPQDAESSSGMTVEEEELRIVSAQIVYHLHCQCGRSWFALELETFAKCPACKKVGLVSL
jgi:hypothetical protein